MSGIFNKSDELFADNINTKIKIYFIMSLL